MNEKLYRLTAQVPAGRVQGYERAPDAERAVAAWHGLCALIDVLIESCIDAETFAGDVQAYVAKAEGDDTG